MQVRKIILTVCLGAMSLSHAHAGFNFLNRMIMGKNGITPTDESFEINWYQPEWIQSPKPEISREDFYYLRNVIGQDFYFAEIEFQVDVQGNVVDAKILSSNGVTFKNQEILRAALAAKVEPKFKQGTVFPFTFKAPFYFSH